MTGSDPVRRLVAEALGTCLLVATVVGSGVMATRLTDDLALALLANTLATGAILAVLITVLAPLSGAHFNPAVTAALLLRRQIGGPLAALYVVAQVVGGVLGTALAHLMFDLPVLQLALIERSGPGQWLSEGVAAAGLVAVILLGQRHAPAGVPALVGLYIAAAYWFTASTSFANPAVTLARALTDSFAGIRPLDVPAFIVAQFVGAACATLLVGWLLADLKNGRRS